MARTAEAFRIERIVAGRVLPSRSSLSHSVCAVVAGAARGTVGEGGRSGDEPAFVPVTVRTHYIEVLLPGGGLVRLSAGIDRSLLLDVIRSVSAVLKESQS